MKYFAYGSNIDQNRMAERVETAKILGAATLLNYELKFNKIATKNDAEGFANIVEKQGGRIEGVLYEVENFDSLDSYEGFPLNYTRVELEVIFKSQKILATVYIACENKVDDSVKPSKEYLQHLLNGKPYFSEAYYDTLTQTSTLSSH